LVGISGHHGGAFHGADEDGEEVQRRAPER
jgi:hypothetical protein